MMKKEEDLILSICQIDKKDWCQPLIDYLEHEKLSNEVHHKTEIKHRAISFVYYKGTLHQRFFEGVWLCCLGEDEARKALKEPHSEVCEAHQSSPKLHFRSKRMGYYWPTMAKECMDYAKKCPECHLMLGDWM